MVDGAGGYVEPHMDVDSRPDILYSPSLHTLRSWTGTFLTRDGKGTGRRPLYHPDVVNGPGLYLPCR